KDDEEIFGFVEIEAVDDAETRAKRRCDKSCSSSGAYKREMVEMEGMDARARPLADDKGDAKIFHGGVKDFFDRGLKAMDLGQEENFAKFERSENGSEVAFAFEKRTGAGLDGDVQFIGDDLCERGFAETRRAVEQHVIEGFAAIASSFKCDRDVFFD